MNGFPERSFHVWFLSLPTFVNMPEHVSICTCTHGDTADKVAIKVVDTSRLDAKALRMLSREVSTLECVYHPFILR